MRRAVTLLAGLLSAWLMWQEVPSPPEWGLKSDWTIKGSYTTYEDCVGDLGRVEDLWSTLTGVEPPKLSPEERKSERWNIYMPRWIRQRIERAAALEGMSPSQFLQRLCGPWAATWQEPPEGTP